MNLYRALAVSAVCAALAASAQAQIPVVTYVEGDVNLSVAPRLPLHPGPTWKSYANAFLINTLGQRVYEQILLTHEAGNLYSYPDIFVVRIQNNNGYASNNFDKPGEVGNCYYAKMEGYSTRYGRLIKDAAPQCIPEETAEIGGPKSPIVLDLNRDGVHLSGPQPAVLFDLDADGHAEQTAWTASGQDDAFLCLDRNANGRIDDGSELFGNATPLAAGGKAGNGYRALGEFDEPRLGGNGDGAIDATDAVFHRLSVWLDSNRDGQTDAGELRPLYATDILELGYDSRETKIRDEFGNWFWYRSYAKTGPGRRMNWPTYDVIFAEP